VGAVTPQLVIKYIHQKSSPSSESKVKVAWSDPESPANPEAVQADLSAPRVILSEKALASAFGFAGGAMVFGTLFDILPGSVAAFSLVDQIGDSYANLVSLCFMYLGIMGTIALEVFVKWLDPNLDCPCHAQSCVDENTAKSMKSTSWITFAAMTLHHLPEGIVWYLTATSGTKTGAIVGLILLIHVFPEGISIGIPAYVSFPSQPWRPGVYGLIAGLAHPLGAVIAYGAFGTNQPSNLGLGITTGITSGMLLTIALRGLLPYTRALDPQDKVSSLYSFLGAFVVFFSISMFGIAGFDG